MNTLHIERNYRTSTHNAFADGIEDEMHHISGSLYNVILEATELIRDEDGNAEFRLEYYSNEYIAIERNIEEYDVIYPDGNNRVLNINTDQEADTRELAEAIREINHAFARKSKY